jgi:hypothetical protein
MGVGNRIAEEKNRHMSDPASDPAALPLIVQAVDALLAERADDARRWLHSAIDASSLRDVNHRLNVVGRNLLADADLDPERGPAPEAAAIDALDDADQFAAAWSALETVAMLVARADFPAEVVLDPGT